ncbi:MAG TPA: CHAD domain-containing protein [Planctomycetota bacterium]|nr:CHAD domain-containing protein [Planctomycetota bacterium]
MKSRSSAPAKATAAATLRPRAVRLEAELWHIRRDPSDQDAIHDARVAARRILAAGELWASGSAAWVRLRDRLTKLTKRLGKVRNLDVAIELLDKDPRLSEKVPSRFVRLLRKARRKERRRLESWLTRRRIRGVSTAGDLEAGSRVPAPRDLVPHFKRLRKQLLRISQGGPHLVDAGHEARRELRRLRYSHETLEWAYGHEAFQAAVQQFRELQDLAGRWHDLCVLGDLAKDSLGGRKEPAGFRDLFESIGQESADLVERYARSLTELLKVQPQLTGGLSP